MHGRWLSFSVQVLWMLGSTKTYVTPLYKNFNLNVRADSRTNIMHDLRQRALRKMSSNLPRSEGPRTKTENEAFFVLTKNLELNGSTDYSTAEFQTAVSFECKI